MNVDKKYYSIYFVLLAAVSACMLITARLAPPNIVATETEPTIDMPIYNTVFENIRGCYVFDENIYTNPLSSFVAFGKMPYIYGFTEDEFIIANTDGGDLQNYAVEYCKKPVGFDEFSSKINSPLSPPQLTAYKERYLLAVISDGNSSKYSLYSMDSEIWLAEFRGNWIWSIYRLTKTQNTTLADLKRAKKYYADNPPYEWTPGLYENPPRFYENQMTLKDVYTLARKGGALTLIDFEPFYYHLSGSDFTERRYEVAGADIVFVRVKDGMLDSAMLWSRRTLDPAQVIDLREGFEAIAKYQDPLSSFADITIEDTHIGEDMRELIYNYDYDQCCYYLNTKRADSIFVVFGNDKRLPLKRALEERLVTIEEAVAHGLRNVSMVPIVNPLGGEFVTLQHPYAFSMNNEAFYPSKSFMYVVWDNDISVYFDMDELTQFLEWYGYDEKAKELRQSFDLLEITAIARGNYVRGTTLAAAGIIASVGWEFSFHTPVRFIFTAK